MRVIIINDGPTLGQDLLDIAERFDVLAEGQVNYLKLGNSGRSVDLTASISHLVKSKLWEHVVASDGQVEATYGPRRTGNGVRIETFNLVKAPEDR